MAAFSVILALILLEHTALAAITSGQEASAAAAPSQQRHSLGTTLKGCEHFVGYTWTYYSPFDSMEYCCQTHMVSYDFDYAHLEHILHGGTYEDDEQHFQPCCCPRFANCSLSLQENSCHCTCSHTDNKPAVAVSAARKSAAPSDNIRKDNGNSGDNRGAIGDPVPAPTYSDLLEPSLLLEVFFLSILLRIVYWCFWLQEHSERHWRILQAYQYAQRNEQLSLMNHQWSVTSLRHAYSSIEEEAALAMCEATAAAA